MDAKQLCRNYLQIIDSMPQPVPWIVILVGGCILIVDVRDEAKARIMEAIAQRFGDIVAVAPIPSRQLKSRDLQCWNATVPFTFFEVVLVAMSPLSGPTLVVCSTALLIAGAYHHHSDTGLFLSACGVLIGLLGLFLCLRKSDTGSPGLTPD